MRIYGYIFVHQMARSVLGGPVIHCSNLYLNFKLYTLEHTKQLFIHSI